jgi:DMSO reductase anchor subunit
MEITLVVLTTLAPAGIAAYALLSTWVLVGHSPDRAQKASRWLIVALVFPLLGFVASATHLGTPANALYVLTGIGRSPLSNEVAAIVAFLVLGGCYWILSFSEKPVGTARRAFLGVVIVSALIALFFIGRAHDVYTIPTWSLPLAPASLWMGGLSAGPAIVVFSLLCARALPGRRDFAIVITITAVAALMQVACLAHEAAALPGIQTTVHTATALVPHYPGMIVAYAALMLASIAALVATSKMVAKGVSAKRLHWTALCWSAASVLCACVACFLVRFGFYCMYMTVGM